MTRLTIKIMSLMLGVLPIIPAQAMQYLDDIELQDAVGQAGADFSLKLVLNHKSDDTFDTTVCADLVYCRLGMSLNNRYHDGSQDSYDVNGVRTPSPTGRKQWLVFKGIQGTINIQQIALDGEDVVYSGSTVQAAIKLGFTPTKPIEIRNLGFQSLSIETDTVAAEGVGNTPGYLTPATLYSASGVTGFDASKEKGFLGLNINTNLSLTGSIKIFSCSSGHPRC
jgi:hypothetical protein